MKNIYVANKTEIKRIILGYPLDLLFDRNCKLHDYIDALKSHDDLIKVHENLNSRNKTGEIGGIILPEDENPGTGNIVIRGKPGTAKSTFALQMAIAATVDKEVHNNSMSIYLSLEESPENVITKANAFGWNVKCKKVDHLKELSELSSIKDYADELTSILRIEGSSKIEAKVLFPMLTPGNLFHTDNHGDTLFLERYKQIENLLAAARYARNPNGNIENTEEKFPRLAFVIIDSINVFGDKPLTREELNRLFLLFKKFKVIGVFIVEDQDYTSLGSLSSQPIEIVDYLADVVISLSTDEDDGYFLRYFEIKKSRYQHQVYGKHPYRLNKVN